MSDFFETLKNDAEKGWDAVKEAARDIHDETEENLDDWHNLYGWANGDLVSFPVFSDSPSAKDQEMKTLAVMMIKDRELVSPASGTVTAVDVDNNLIAINISDKLTVAVKVCTGAVSLSSDLAHVQVKPGESVTKGQPLVKFSRLLEAKSKMILTATGTWDQFKALEEKPAREAGAIAKGDLLITKA